MLSPASVADFSPTDFDDGELDLPYYLSHFHRVVNAVEMDGPDRGFINNTGGRLWCVGARHASPIAIQSIRKTYQ